MFLLALFCGSLATAQSVALSPAQQRLLNQLPPAQRSEALQQLRQFSQQSESAALPTEVESSGDKTVTSDPSQPFANSPVAEPKTPKFEPGDTLVISINQNVELMRSVGTIGPGTPQTNLVDNIRANNPYQLDHLGQLQLPGIRAIDVAGLTEEQATLRLMADPALRGFDVSATLLPLSDVGVKALKPFGYDLFTRKQRQPTTNRAMPIPANFVVGPGDDIKVQLYGSTNAEYNLVIERDGAILFPGLGPIAIGGLNITQLRELIGRRVNEQLIGTQVSVSLGELRAIQVFLVGDVNEPGSYTVGSLSTVTTVLTVGGGVATNGSLRRIQVKRAGMVVRSLDVYNLLLHGDTSDDIRVQEGDVVFVPPVGKTISVTGEIKRPAIYEYIGAANVDDIIGLAGGLTAGALTDDIRLERQEPDRGTQTIDVDLGSAKGKAIKVADGDTLHVPSGLQDPDNSVRVVGNVHRPGLRQWFPGVRLSDVIDSSREVKAGTDLEYVLIRREPVPNAGPIALSASLSSAWAMRGGLVDLKLEPRDTIYVFDVKVGRTHIIEPLIEEMRLRSNSDSPLAVVSVGGSVNAPGTYPLEPGMRIADLVRAAGGFSQSAFTSEAELTRYRIGISGDRDTSIIEVDLHAAASGSESENLPLAPFDYLQIREVPNWSERQFIEILGEVRFPGRYPIKKGESMHSVLARAGGLTELAYAAGSIFTREALKQREREQLDTLAYRVERDLASMSLSDPGQVEALSIGQTLLTELRETEPAGRLVIELDQVLSEEALGSITIRDGDKLRIPRQPEEVTVIGEVQYATSHLFQPGLIRNDYILRSGGLTAKADRRRIYIVRASGEVMVENRSRFFARPRATMVRAGDTIVVPLDTDKVRTLTLWTGVSQVVYNLAIAATAVSRF